MANLGSKTLITTRNTTDRVLVTQFGDTESKEALPNKILGIPIARTLTDSDNLVAADAFNKVVFNIGTNKNCTVPASVFAAGDVVYVERTGAGVLSFVAGGGMTLTTSLGALTDAGANNVMTLIFTSPTACSVYNGIPLNLTSGDVINALGYTPSKRILLFKEVTPASHTGTTGEVVLGQYLVPAGTVQPDDIIVIRARFAKTGTAGSYNGRLRVGSAGTTADTQFGIVSPGATQQHTYFKRDIHFIDSVASQEVIFSTLNAASDEQTSSALPSAFTIDFANQQYISLTLNLTNSADTGILKYFYIEIVRS